MTREPRAAAPPIAATPGRDPSPAGALARAVRMLESRATSVRFPVLLVLAVGIAAIGQLVEDLVDDPAVQMLAPASSIPRWTVIALTAYMLLVVRRTDRVVEHSLAAIERVVHVGPGDLERYGRRLRCLGPRIDLALLAIAAVFVSVLFAAADYPLPVRRLPDGSRIYLPAGPAAVPILAGYAVTGWAGLRLIHSTLRRATVVGRLTRERISVDVFDITDLLPFGRIALAIALGPAGVIAILLLGLGVPGGALAWSVIFLSSVATVLALLLPLRGIHAQMDHARDATLADLNQRLGEIHRLAIGPVAAETPTPGQLNERASLLIHLRKVVSDMTTWPFQDTAALARAVLVVSAPLIYATLTELIKLYLIPSAR